MSEELIKRLRDYGPCLGPGVAICCRRTVDEAADRIAELEAALKEARDAIALYACHPCPVCNGDCSSANPPVYACPTQAAYRVFHRQALKGPDHADV